MKEVAISHFFVVEPRLVSKHPFQTLTEFLQVVHHCRDSKNSCSTFAGITKITEIENLKSRNCRLLMSIFLLYSFPCPLGVCFLSPLYSLLKREIQLIQV